MRFKRHPNSVFQYNWFQISFLPITNICLTLPAPDTILAESPKRKCSYSGAEKGMLQSPPPPSVPQAAPGLLHRPHRNMITDTHRASASPRQSSKTQISLQCQLPQICSMWHSTKNLNKVNLLKLAAYIFFFSSSTVAGCWLPTTCHTSCFTVQEKNKLGSSPQPF